MRPIKFRGKSSMSGDFVYGYLIHNCIGAFGFWQSVVPESVAQLLGYDADGNEIYEGDKVIDQYGDELTAVFVSGSFYEPDDDLTNMSHLRLKE